MKCLILFSGKKKKKKENNINILKSDEFSQKVIKIKY